MFNDDFEILLQQEIAAHRSLDDLETSLFNDENTGETARLFAVLAERDASQPADSLTTLEYYRGMRGSLGEADFRWRELEFPTAPETTNNLRRQRILQYHQYRELFDLEIAIARKQKRAAMALSHDWSGMAGYFRESLQIAKYRGMLRLAGLLYISRIPGALDLCDAAAFEMFRLVYRREAS